MQELRTTPTAADLESGIQEPEIAHLTRHDSDIWPMQSSNTVQPTETELQDRQTSQHPFSDFSMASGMSCEDLPSAPSPIHQKYSSSYDSVRSKPQDSGNDEMELVRLNTSYEDRVATKEQLDGLAENYPLPTPKHSERYNFLRHTIFTTYRRLFALVLLINLAIISWAGVLASRSPPQYSYAQATTGVAANIFVGIMMRHEHSVNLIFRVMTALPLWLPLSIRRHAAKVYSYGGVHSSCGISAFIWYLFFAVLLLTRFESGREAEKRGLAAILALMILIFLVLIIMSYPSIRQRFHNLWEQTHRFAGWTAIGLIWAQTILIAVAEARKGSNLGKILLTTPAFWFLCLITLTIIYPWLRLRHRTFTVEPLSTHATRLHFAGKNLATCKGVKLSTSPLTENHAFAGIPNAQGCAQGHSVIIANNGDWTKSLINKPPEKLWVKGAPVSGVVRLAFLFRRIVIVATGSGIGPCTSFFNVHPEWDVRIIWAARSPATSFGTSTVESIFAADPKALLIDTKKTGKGGLTETCFAVYQESGAEAVVVISNPVATKEVVFALESRGVPAYGAIWDS